MDSEAMNKAMRYLLYKSFILDSEAHKDNLKPWTLNSHSFFTLAF